MGNERKELKERKPKKNAPEEEAGKESVETSTGKAGDFTLRWLTPPFSELNEPPPAGRDGVAAGTSSYDALPGEIIEGPDDG
ncbi:MAG: hypothetical protein SX243_07375 [Acidobacteriota bacterium]|nr:hypothetical protein [Acidobacteriota bacterium]